MKFVIERIFLEGEWFSVIKHTCGSASKSSSSWPWSSSQRLYIITRVPWSFTKLN